MRAALDGEPWDSSSRDWSMPQLQRPRGARRPAKRRASTCRSSSSRARSARRRAVEAMRAGAHDYVLKDKLARLAPAVERELRETRTREHRRERREALRASEAALRAALGVRHHRHLARRRASATSIDANDAYLGDASATRARSSRAGTVHWASMTPPEWRRPTSARSSSSQPGGRPALGDRSTCSQGRQPRARAHRRRDARRIRACIALHRPT